jgi:hypothetical protein
LIQLQEELHELKCKHRNAQEVSSWFNTRVLVITRFLVCR